MKTTLLALAALTTLGCTSTPTEPVVEESNPDTCNCDDLVYDEKYNRMFYNTNNELKYSGICQTFYKNQQLKEQRIYVDGMVNGVLNTWHSNGQQASEQTFENNMQEGEYKTWDENGKVTYRAMYKNGALEEVLPFTE